MLAACAIAGFRWYVIYSNREIHKKKHLTSTHGQIGAAVMAAYILLVSFHFNFFSKRFFFFAIFNQNFISMSFYALNPDNGIFKGNQTVRAIHKWSGRRLTSSAWALGASGFNTLYPDTVPRVAFTIPLLILWFFVLVLILTCHEFMNTIYCMHNPL